MSSKSKCPICKGRRLIDKEKCSLCNGFGLIGDLQLKQYNLAIALHNQNNNLSHIYDGRRSHNGDAEHQSPIQEVEF